MNSSRRIARRGLHGLHRPATAAVLAIAGVVPAMAGTLPVPSVYPTVRAALVAAAPGDTVALECGTYPEDLLEIPSGIVLRSVHGDPGCATIRGTGGATVLFGARLSADTRIEGLTITGGDASNHGGGGYFSDSDLTFSQCVFLANETANWGGGLAFQGTSSPVIADCLFLKNRSLYGGGIYCEGGAVTVERCFFHRNEARISGGGLAAWSGGSHVLARDCVFGENEATYFRGGGVFAYGADISLVGCTLVANHSGIDGSAVSSRVGGRVLVKRCIVAYHFGGAALACDATGRVELSCSDVWKNLGDDWAGCGPGSDVGDNFSEDPLFCDRGAADYTLRSDSPCLPSPSAPCGLVGALGAGCGAVHVEVLGWGVIKSRYR